MSPSKKAKGTTKIAEVTEDAPVFHSRKERLNAGELLRESVPHSVHSVWKPPRKHRDPIDLLEESTGIGCLIWCLSATDACCAVHSLFCAALRD
jgi:hypothetical protein